MIKNNIWINFKVRFIFTACLEEKSSMSHIVGDSFEFNIRLSPDIRLKLNIIINPHVDKFTIKTLY